MKVKKAVIAVLFVVLALVAATCILAYISFAKKNENLVDVNLYFYNSSVNTITAEKRSINKTDDHNLLLSYVEAAYREGPKNSSLVSAMPSGVDFTVTNNDKSLNNVVDIDLSDTFNALSESQRLVFIGSVVYTFSDIDFIDDVRLSCDGENISELYNMYGEGNDCLNVDNVVNNPIINPEKIDRQTVVLYFLDLNGTKLKAEKRSIEVKQSQTLEYQIVEQLIGGPESEELKGLIPDGVKIKDIKTEDGICYVNLSGDFVNKLSGSVQTEKLVLYSIVNSLTELNTVNKVQFLIEGEKVSEFKGHYDFSKTFERDESLINGK